MQDQKMLRTSDGKLVQKNPRLISSISYLTKFGSISKPRSIDSDEEELSILDFILGFHENIKDKIISFDFLKTINNIQKIDKVSFAIINNMIIKLNGKNPDMLNPDSKIQNNILTFQYINKNLNLQEHYFDLNNNNRYLPLILTCNKYLVSGYINNIPIITPFDIHRHISNMTIFNPSIRLNNYPNVKKYMELGNVEQKKMDEKKQFNVVQQNLSQLCLLNNQQGKKLRICTWNILSSDSFDGKDDEDSKDANKSFPSAAKIDTQKRYAIIVNEINKINPDILLLQEVPVNYDFKLPNYRLIAETNRNKSQKIHTYVKNGLNISNVNQYYSIGKDDLKNDYQIVVFKYNNKKYIIGNYHINKGKYADLPDCDVFNLDKISADYNKNNDIIIIAGDFNHSHSKPLVCDNTDMKKFHVFNTNNESPEDTDYILISNTSSIKGVCRYNKVNNTKPLPGIRNITVKGMNNNFPDRTIYYLGEFMSDHNYVVVDIQL